MYPRHTIFWIWVFLLPLTAFGQTESLRDTLAVMPDDTAKVRLIHAFLDQHPVLPADTTIAIASIGVALAERLEERTWVARILIFQAFGQMDAGERDSANVYFDRSAQISRAQQDTFTWARALLNKGMSEYFFGNDDFALTHYQGAAVLFDKIGRPNATLFNNMAVIYRKQEKYTHAIDLYGKSLALKRASGDSIAVATTYMNMALLYEKELDTLPAYSLGEKAYALISENGAPADIAWANVALGTVYFNFEEVKKAKNLLENAILFYEKYPRSDYYYLALYDLGEISSVELEFAKSEQYFKRALSIAREKNKTEDIQGILKNLSRVLNKQGKSDEAYRLLQESMALKDTLTNRTRLALTEEMLARFEVGQKENQLKIQELEIERRKLNQRTTWWLLGTSLLITVGGLFFLFQKNKVNRVLKKKNLQIEQSLVEKEGLMREIHHRVKNNLQFISSMLRMQSRHLTDEKAREALDGSQSRVLSMAMIHQHLYQKAELTGIRLDTYLERLISELIASFQPPDCTISLVTQLDSVVLDIEKAVPLGLIANELVCNSLKYAFSNRKEGRLTASLKDQEGRLLLTIQDDGPGFSEKNIPDENPSFGYKLVEMLTEKLKGELTFDQGTEFSVCLEIPKEKPSS